MPSENWQQRIKDYEELKKIEYVAHSISSVIIIPKPFTVYVSVLGAIGDYAVYYGSNEAYLRLEHYIEWLVDHGGKSYDDNVYQLFVNEYKTLVPRM